MRRIRFKKLYPALLVFALALFLVGVILGDVRQIVPGLITILRTEDALITDYVAIGGIGAAFVNAAVVCAITVGILWFSGDPANGYTFVEMGLMTGFAFFGKNFLNIWPIILGTFLYAKVERVPFRKYASVSLLATALAPAVSFVALGDHWASPGAGLLLGIAIGFVLPPLSGYTFRIQNGMNLYNMGFACGLLAMLMVPVMTTLGVEPTIAHHWSEGNELPFGLLLCALCAVLIIIGLFACGQSWRAALSHYRRLLQTTGRAPSDYLRMFGMAPTLVNMGVNGLLGTAVILLAGGDLNGPTLGGILTIMGFSAFGKHARNIVPVMAGVLLGALVMGQGLASSSLQLAILFGTALAPVSGYFGWPVGVLAGFLHASVVLSTASPVAGMNLYNNGFSAGLIAIVLFPVLTTVFRHARPVLQDQDYYEVFEHDEPLAPISPAEERHNGEEGH